MIKLNIPRISLPKKSTNCQSINQAYRSMRYVDSGEKATVDLAFFNRQNKLNFVQKVGKLFKSLFYANK